MSDRIRIIKHEAIPGCGSSEVRFPDRGSRYFYWNDLPSRRLRPETPDRETVLENARAAPETFTLATRNIPPVWIKGLPLR